MIILCLSNRAFWIQRRFVAAYGHNPQKVSVDILRKKSTNTSYKQTYRTWSLCLSSLFSCLWAGETSSTGSPSCFYADNDGYQMMNSEEIPQGYRVMLQRTATDVQPYGPEYQNLVVTVTKMTKHTVRIKVNCWSFCVLFSSNNISWNCPHLQEINLM